MPELPEVETVKNMLKPVLIGSSIIDIEIVYDKIIKTDNEFFKSVVKNATIIDLKRKAKYLIFCLDNGYSFTSHLRMEGKYFIEDEKVENKHSHIYFKLSNNKYLIYNDTRKFGEMILKKNEDLYNTLPLSKLGQDANEKDINPFHLKEKLNRNACIKTLLLNQTILSGLGNIYVDEVLFLCKINPLVKGKDLSVEDVKNLILYSNITLEKAINLGGSTIKSFKSGHADGLFQNHLLVHTKQNKPCINCHTSIQKIQVNKRGTYYCPNCQKFFDNSI